MASALVSSGVDRGFKPRLDQTKYYEIGCYARCGREKNQNLVGPESMRAVTCLPADCCYSELETIKLKLSVRM